MKKYLLIIVCCASMASATMYNMTTGWDDATNWVYGSKVETGVNSGVFGVFKSAIHNDLGWLERWVDEDTYAAGDYQTWVGMSKSDIWIPLNKVSACPWVVYDAVVRFTNAETGTYDLSAMFNGLDVGGTGTKTVYIQKNDVTIWSSTFSGLDSRNVNLQLSLIPTDTVDFIVTDTGTCSCVTQLDATLTLVPEPATMILLGLGGVLIRKRKLLK